jgi:hypothetical protein
MDTRIGDMAVPHCCGTLSIGIPHRLENISTCSLDRGGGWYRSRLLVGRPTTPGCARYTLASKLTLSFITGITEWPDVAG